MTVGELCNREVYTALRDDKVVTAARRMRELHVGDLIVVDRTETGMRPVGILTDRDIVVGILANTPHWVTSLTVGEAIQGDLVVAREHEPVSAVLERMRAHGVRRMPVVDDRGMLVGILTYDDVLDWLAEELSSLAAIVAREHRREERQRS